MKKIGIIVFAVAVTVGILISNFFSFGKLTGDIFNFSPHSEVTGSGSTARDERDASGFTAIEAGGVFQIEILAQKHFSVQVEADDNVLPYIRTEVDGDVLRISAEEAIRTKNAIIVRVSAPNIDRVQISGAVRASIKDLQNASLDLDTSGASKVSVNGTTTQLNVQLSGASNVDAAELKSENADVNASGASHAKVNASGDLRIDASGASSVNYSGNPVSLEKHSSGASTISHNN